MLIIQVFVMTNRYKRKFYRFSDLPSFGLRYATFYRAKGGISETKRYPFVTTLIISSLQKVEKRQEPMMFLKFIYKKVENVCE